MKQHLEEKKKWEKCESHSPADSKVSEGGGKGGAPGPGEEFPLQPMVQPTVM